MTGRADNRAGDGFQWKIVIGHDTNGTRDISTDTITDAQRIGADFRQTTARQIA